MSKGKPVLMLKFEIYRSGTGEWRWRARASNGEIVAAGEGYRNRQDCLKTVELIRRYAFFSTVQEVDE
jgi:uncharacterized protein